jgi:hypothetical protein
MAAGLFYYFKLVDLLPTLTLPFFFLEKVAKKESTSLIPDMPRRYLRPLFLKLFLAKDFRYALTTLSLICTDKFGCPESKKH